MPFFYFNIEFLTYATEKKIQTRAEPFTSAPPRFHHCQYRKMIEKSQGGERSDL
jgi:hypothetical protein